MKNLILFLALTLPSLLGSQALAEPAPHDQKNCIAAEDVRRLRARFRFEVERNEDLCDPEKSYTYKLMQALIFMDGLDLSGPLPPAPFNQNMLPQNWSKVVQRLAPAMRGGSRDPWGSGCGGGTLAYVRTVEEQQMFFCAASFRPGASIVELVSTMLHESRHHLGYDHVTCTRGPIAGSIGGCDSSHDDQGGYGADAEAGAKVALTARRVHPATRFEAIALTLQTSMYRINRSPVSSSSVLYLTDTSGQRWMFDGRKIQPALVGVPAGLLYPREDNDLVLYPNDPLQSPQRYVSFSGQNFVTQTARGSYMADYAQQSPDMRSQWKDVLVSSSLSARIVGSRISLSRGPLREPVTIEFDWTDGNAVRMMTAADLGSSAANRVYVLNDQGELFRLEFDDQNRFVKSKIENPAPGVSQISRIGTRRFWLRNDGVIVEKTSDQVKAVPALANLRFREMTREFSRIEGSDWAPIDFSADGP